jgi:hypothetical protein
MPVGWQPASAVASFLVMRNTRLSSRLKRRVRVNVGRAAVFTLDLGPGGFAAEILRALPAGTLVEGTLRLGDQELKYEGQVVWARPGDLRLNLRGRIGVRFTRLPEGAERLLAALQRDTAA